MELAMPTKILVVDDEPKLEALIRQLFRREVRRKELFFSFSQNGRDALAKLEVDREIDLVLTDLNMSPMDGLTLLAELKKLKGFLNPVLTNVVVSAYGDMENIRKAMNAGAFDFVMKPLNLDDFKITVKKTIEHIQQLKKTLEERNAAREALRRANEELEKRVKERTAELEAYGHTVAHDLKNPLATILCLCQVIVAHLSDLKAEETLQYVQFMEQEGKKAVTIIDDLLLLSAVRKGEIRVNQIDMLQIMTQVKGRLALMIEEYQAELITPESWPQAYGYAPWVEQVWLNYLSNALKYGGRPPKVEVGATKIEGAVRFWVRDNGVGIPLEAQAALFTEFTRLAKTKVEGTGLGLSIVKRIVEKLDGQVGAQSKVGQGSEFYFTLPA
jgi:signal transduction histidine kinase